MSSDQSSVDEVSPVSSPSSNIAHIWHEYARAFLADIFGLVLAAIVPAIASRRWGPAKFAEYAIVYRALALLQPPLLVGLGIALPRYLGRLPKGDAAEDGTARPSTTDYLVTVLLIEGVVLAVAVGILVIGAGVWGQVLFNDRRHRELVLILTVLVVGSCLTAIALGYLRGIFAMGRANVVLATYLGIVPLAAILAVRSVGSVLLTTGALWILTAAGGLWGKVPHCQPFHFIGRHLVGFGLRRVPGEICLFGLFAIPPLVATHTHTLSYAGYLAFAISLVTIAGSVFSPLTVVLLPFATRMLSEDDEEGLRAHVTHVLLLALTLALVGTVFLELFMPVGVRLYLGGRFASAAAILRVTSLAIPGYVTFVSLRSSLDAYHYKAVSLRNAIFGFAAFLLLAVLFNRLDIPNPEAWAFVAALWCLAITTLVSVWTSIWFRFAPSAARTDLR